MDAGFRRYHLRDRGVGVSAAGLLLSDELLEVPGVFSLGLFLLGGAYFLGFHAGCLLVDGETVSQKTSRPGRVPGGRIGGMGIWADYFHPRVILRMDVLGWTISAFWAIGGLVLFFDQFTWAAICFGASGALILARIIVQAVKYTGTRWPRFIFAVVVGGAIAGITVGAVIGTVRHGWKKQAQPTQPQAAAQQSPPPTPTPSQPLSQLPPLTQPNPLIDTYRSALAFDAYVENLGNLPERKRLTLTYDDKPWEETKYADVRLEIENTSTVPLENIDLDIDLLGNKSGDFIAGIGQLSDVGGVEFHKPQLPQAKLRLTGKNGKDYIVTSTDIMDAGHPLFFDVRVFCPRLSPEETLRLIIASLLDDPSKRPNHLRIKGTYETTPSEGSKRENVEKIVDVVQ